MIHATRFALIVALLFSLNACQRAKVAPTSEMTSSNLAAEEANEIDTIDEEDPATTDSFGSEETFAEEAVEEPTEEIADEPVGEEEHVEEEEEVGEEGEEYYDEEEAE